MVRNIPKTTLFMLMSLDGKISTGDVDARDFDTDLLGISGIKEGLHQYYEIEKTTDINSFNTGRVMAKIGVNTRKDKKPKIPCNFVIVDNEPHLTMQGVQYLTRWVKTLYIVTTNKNHPAFAMKEVENLKILYYSKKINFETVFVDLRKKYNMKRMTIQSGGNMNAELIRKGLIKCVSIVVAPCLVGGKHTSTLVDGVSLRTHKDLKHVKVLKVQSVQRLKNSYLHLIYTIVK